MRPRVFPAEDEIDPASIVSTGAGFNEAAGIPRGRLAQRSEGRATKRASMRPRVFPAEDD